MLRKTVVAALVLLVLLIALDALVIGLVFGPPAIPETNESAALLSVGGRMLRKRREN